MRHRVSFNISLNSLHHSLQSTASPLHAQLIRCWDPSTGFSLSNSSFSSNYCYFTA